MQIYHRGKEIPKFIIFKTTTENKSVCHHDVSLTQTQISWNGSPWEGSEYVPVLAGDTLWKIARWHRQASLHTFMLPFSLYEMSLRIQCPFALPWLRSLLYCTFSHFARSLSFTVHFPRICFHLPALSFSTLSLWAHSILTLSFFISSSYPALFALLDSTLNDIP